MVLMKERRRLYTEVLTDHLQRHRQMALVSGPRQVGKTTACRSISDTYLNWDNADDRRRLLRGPAALDRTLEAALTIQALHMALARRRSRSAGLVHHSDRGVQYASADYTQLLKDHGIRISMSRKANPW